MAYQWIIDGKIGCHFPERAGLNPNFDVSNIRFTPDGTSGNLQEIESVYYFDQTAIDAITAKSTTAEQLEEANKWRVWHRYWGYVEDKSLAYDSDLTDNYFKIFESPSTMTVTAVNVLTNNNTDVGTTACIIDYETGLTVAYGTTKTIASTVTTAYGLTGYNRSIAFDNPVTLDALKQYYIAVFRPDNNKTYNIAYDTTTTAQNKNKVNIQTTASNISNKIFVGELTGTCCQRIDKVMQTSASIGLCLNKPESTPFDVNVVYGRNSTYANRSWYGISDGQNYNYQGTRPVLSAVKAMSASQLSVANKLSWDSSDGYYLFERTNSIIPSTDLSFTSNDYQAINDMAAFIRTNMNWHEGGATACIFYNVTEHRGYGYDLGNGTIEKESYYSAANTAFTIGGGLTGESTEPGAAVDGSIWYKTGDWNGHPTNSHNSLVIRKNGNWELLKYSDIFTKVQYEFTATYNEINNGWTAIGTANTALMNESVNANNIAGYFKLDKNDGTTIEV